MQLVLPVTYRKQDSFDVFVEGRNTQLVQHIQNVVNNESFREQPSQRISVITGQSGAGKTHLLLATCEYAANQNQSVQFIDLQSVKGKSKRNEYLKSIGVDWYAIETEEVKPTQPREHN